MKKPVVSIVIPTKNSEWILRVALNGIKKQICDVNSYEVIIVDNNSTDETRELARSYGSKVFVVAGAAPQVCKQRNIGTKYSKGKFILFLDHDVELSPNLIRNFLVLLKKRKNGKDAWYIPYKNVASNRILSSIRNLEDEFYLDSLVAAARLVSKSFILKKNIFFDEDLSSGPADWDFNIQLKLAGARFGVLKDPVYHHEERLTFWRYTIKKVDYLKGGERYKKKWKSVNRRVYENIVRKQYDPIYRFFTIFFEKGKWKRLILRLHIYLLFLISKFIMAATYYLNYLKK